jgi:hypothetical protein
MPRVPTYGDPQARTEALPGVRRSFDPGNPGAAIGRGMQQLGADVQEVYLAEQKKQSEIAVLEADRKLSSWSVDTLNNPETGALNRRGKDSFGLHEEVLPAFDKTALEIEKGLTNDAQRQTFRRLSTGRRGEIDQTLAKHVSGELRRFEDNELEAYTANAHAAALANPDVAGNEIERQRMAIGNYADRNGMGPEWFKLKFGSAASKTHLGVVDGLLARGEDQKALGYFQANGAQFLGEDRTRAEKALDVGTLRGVSQRLADQITREYSEPAAMIAAVEQIKDPKVRDATEERVQRKIRFLADVSKQENDKAFTDAWTVVEETGDANRVPPAVWGALAPQRRKALEDYARQKASGQDIANDDKKWLEFLALPDRNLTEMTEADLLGGYIPSFDKAHRERAMTRWADAKAAASGDKAGAGKHAATRSFDDVVSSTLSKAGIGLELGYSKKDIQKLSEEKQRVVADFEAKADSAIKQYEKTQLLGKRAANSEEMQKIVDGLLLQKVFVSGRFWGGAEKPAATMTESERTRAQWPEAPRDPAQRTAGQTYNTPKGSLTWTGKSWRQN